MPAATKSQSGAWRRWTADLPVAPITSGFAAGRVASEDTHARGACPFLHKSQLSLTDGFHTAVVRYSRYVRLLARLRDRRRKGRAEVETQQVAPLSDSYRWAALEPERDSGPRRGPDSYGMNGATALGIHNTHSRSGEAAGAGS